MEEAKRNYKKLARQYHPDFNKDPHAEEAMKVINKAYALATGKEKPAMPPQQPQPQQPIVVRWTWTTYTYGSPFTASGISTNGSGYW